ncbi:hypothetical protein L798_10167 [Zootermopsis nevadensis]|uniref:Uncharacterized protein n=1 Tax=Zootermopsis nevadensis TaxID=136037 RepID=A0A067R1J7_ZOONE|nr:hypothetical protein L798_10167 [Zootermopsis nevadensis]
MGRHPLIPAAVPDLGPVPSSRLLLVAVFAAALLSLFSSGNSRGVAALSFPIPVIAAPEPATYDVDQEEEHRANSREKESSRLGEEEVTKLKQRILEGLGLTRTPDASKMNVSQEEYARMYAVYLRSVDDNRRRRQREQRQEMEHERLGGVTAQRFYSFTHAGKYFVF